MNTETGHITSFVTEEVPAGYVRIPSDPTSQQTLSAFNRAQRRKYAALIRRGMEMRAAIREAA